MEQNLNIIEYESDGKPGEDADSSKDQVEPQNMNKDNSKGNSPPKKLNSMIINNTNRSKSEAKAHRQKTVNVL